MAKITFDNMRAMRYGVHLVGAHLHLKLRCQSVLIDRMLTDKELVPYLPDLTVIHNKKRTHAHIAGVFHQNTGFMDIFYRVRKRQEVKTILKSTEPIQYTLFN